MSDKIYTMPRDRFEPPKRRVPLHYTYLFYGAIIGPWLALTWGEDRRVITTVLSCTGGLYLSRDIARFFMNERATHQELKAMKAQRAVSPEPHHPACEKYGDDSGCTRCNR